MIVYLLTLETSDFSVRLLECVSPSYISISYHYVCVYVRMYIVSSMRCTYPPFDGLLMFVDFFGGQNRFKSFKNNLQINLNPSSPS